MARREVSGAGLRVLASLPGETQFEIRILIQPGPAFLVETRRAGKAHVELRRRRSLGNPALGALPEAHDTFVRHVENKVRIQRRWWRRNQEIRPRGPQRLYDRDDS